MSYPDNPVLSYSYTGFQQSQGNFSFPGTNLDNDLASITAAIKQINAFFPNFVRSDGKLAAGSVTKAALDASLLLGVGSPTQWATAKTYADGDTVVISNKLYVAKADHTSGVFATDLAAGRWLLLADFTAFTLADGSVVGAKLADLTVAAGKLADNAVIERVIAAAAVSTAKLRDGAATEPKLGDGAVSTRVIADAAVTTAKQADGSTTTAKLADKAVTKGKMADVGAQRVVGNDGVVAGAPADISVTQMLDWLSSIQGAVLYRGSAGWQALAPGTVGQVLKSNGANADPSFATLPGTGTVTAVTGAGGLTGNVTGSGSISIDTQFGIVGSYAMAMFTGSGLAIPGQTISGTSLRATCANNADSYNSTLPGIWRCMGLVAAGSGGATTGVPGSVTLWQRVS